MTNIEFDFDEPGNVDLDTLNTGNSMRDIDIDTISTAPRRPPKKKRVMFKRPVVEEEEDIDMDEDDVLEFAEPGKISKKRDIRSEAVEHEEEEEDEVYAPGYSDYNSEPTPSEGFRTIEDEKEDILKKFVTLERKGLTPSKKYTHFSDILEMRQELKRLTHALELEHSLKFSKKMLMACITGLEFLNKRFDPFNVDLDGWSESVMSNINDYDGVFERLHEKYGNKVSVAPELELIFMVGGSAFMFHLTNTLFKTKLPNMESVMKQNPDIMKNLMNSISNPTPSVPTSAPARKPNIEKKVTPESSGGRREMKGPEIGMSNLMIPSTSVINENVSLPTHLLPLPEISNNPGSDIALSNDVIDDLSELESMSDSVSMTDEVKDLNISDAPKKKKRGRKKKNEIDL